MSLLECPNCQNTTYQLAESGRLGPKDYIAVGCAKCEVPLARLTVDEMHSGFGEQLRK